MSVTAADFAAELQRGVGWLRFKPEVEEEFRGSHALRVRPQAKFWQSIQLAAGISFFLVVSRGGFPDELEWLLLGCSALHVALSVALVVVVFGRHYRQQYLRVAAALTPIRAAAFATIVAVLVASGGTGTAAVTVNLFGLLFFSGLLLRQALPAALVMLVSFFGSLWVFDAPGALAAYSVTTLLIVSGLAGFVAWDTQCAARTAFLQHGLTRADASCDALTGLMNRRQFDASLHEMWRACGEGNRALTALLIDVDHFKAYNDHYGHQSGDEVLRRVAKALQGAAREEDLVARFGGEEMALLATGLDERGAARLAEGLRRAVEELGIPHAGAPEHGRVTVSIGGACIAPLPNRSAAGILQLTDQNLYAAKCHGRNRAVMHGEQYALMQTGMFRRPDSGP
jgi:diguanylate cyclase (GGDEF)-like protein